MRAASKTKKAKSCPLSLSGGCYNKPLANPLQLGVTDFGMFVLESKREAQNLPSLVKGFQQERVADLLEVVLVTPRRPAKGVQLAALFAEARIGSATNV